MPPEGYEAGGEEEKCISRSAVASLCYAQSLNRRFELGEPVIAKSSGFFKSYAKNVLGMNETDVE